MSEQIKEPSHYTSATGQVWDVLDVWFADDPLLWNCGKYLARAGKKGDKLTDLLKAQSYLQRRIDALERQIHIDIKEKATLVERDLANEYPPHDAWERK